MSTLATPLIFAVLFWWASTGAVLWLVSRRRDTFKWTALGATLLLGAATVALLALRNETGISAAYAGFAVGIALWAWHEVMFLLGFISGPRKSPCPPHLSTWRRFIASAQTVIHHEIAIAIHAGLIVVMSWGAANQIAAWTFCLLWGMRLSTKLVVFFGAPNITDTFLPAHLDYLKTYFRKRTVAAFFLPAVILATSAAGALGYQAWLAPSGSFHATGFALLAVLATLAVLEHWALVLPVPDAALWGWAAPRHPNSQQRNTESSQWRR